LWDLVISFGGTVKQISKSQNTAIRNTGEIADFVIVGFSDFFW
jgi:hypothetical protein